MPTEMIDYVTVTYATTRRALNIATTDVTKTNAAFKSPTARVNDTGNTRTAATACQVAGCTAKS